MSATVAVVIPYFQRDQHILRRSIDSVLGQRDSPPIQLVVVDDGSPIPAEAELRGYGPDVRNRITMVRQSNRGPGPARNVGLDNLPANARWVAFLDSDDTWSPDHIRKAVGSLERGYDLFFADHIRLGEDLTLFQLAGLRSEEHVLLDAQNNTFAFKGDLFTHVLTYSPIGTSTVVFRRAGNESLRFQGIYRTYEDSLFWLHFAAPTRRIAFGTDVQVVYGRGVNISRRPHWRTNRSLEILRDIDGMYRLIWQKFDLTPSQTAFVNRLSQKNREAFARTVVGMLTAGQPINRAVVSEVFGSASTATAACLRIMLRESFSRVAGLVYPLVVRPHD